MIEHNFKKKFGQNFLQDNNIIKKIADVASPSKEDLIIEIGPGSGALTKELVKKILNSYDNIEFATNKLLEKLQNDNLLYGELFVNFKEYSGSICSWYFGSI